MPYRHAHWWVLGVFPLAALAFWPNYLSQVATAPFQLHAHGITASLWLALLALQSWGIHAGRRPLHRSLGKVSLALFPLFLAGGMGIFIGMAQRYVGHASPFHVTYAPRLAWLDIVSVAGFALFYFQALRQRRTVALHAGWLLATVIFLLPPILGRLSQLLPPLAAHGPQDFWKLGVGFQLANAASAAIALAIAARAGKSGLPFLAAAALTAVGALLYQFVGGTAGWESLYARAADLPAAPLDLLAAAVGGLIAWAGWIAGQAPGARRAVAA